MHKSTRTPWSKPSPTIVILSFVVLFTLSLAAVYARANNKTITPKQLKRIAINPKIFMVNIHTPYNGEIAQTDTFIAAAELQTSEALPKDMLTPIVLYDGNGTSGKDALAILHTRGYKNIHYLAGGMKSWEQSGEKLIDLSTLEESVLPKDGFELPILWGTLGKQLVDLGVIDLYAFQDAVPLTTEQKLILTERSDERIRITTENSQFVVDVLWALGLAQKSTVFTDGPLGKEAKDDVGNFASTGGWNLAKGMATDHLNKYELIPLTESQHAQVADIAHHVYRPCCNNSTWFPDCNHGMAALAIIELLVSQNIDEATIYKKMLGFNSFWFPDSYLTIAAYFARMGIPWNEVDAKTVLGFPYSSGTGAQKISELVGPLPFTTTFVGGCGV